MDVSQLSQQHHLQPVESHGLALVKFVKVICDFTFIHFLVFLLLLESILRGPHQ